MSEHKAVPNIRFRSFEANWIEKSFQEILTINSGKDYKNLSLGNIPVYGTGGLMLYVNKSLSNKDAVGIGRKGTINKPQYLKAPFWTVDTLFFMIPRKNFDISFIFCLSQKINWKKYDESTGLPSLSKRVIGQINSYVPVIKEQQKIGDFFTKLDKLLDFQQQKIEKLELLKKALLQKLFPKHDAKIPELRFKGYDHEWEEKKFSSLYKKCNEKNNLSFGNDKIISVANMYYKKDNVKSDDNYMKTYNIFRLGDIAFEGHKSKKFTFGRFVENTIGDGIVSHVFEVFRPISNGDITYWKYAIHNEDFIAPILMKSTVKATMMNNLIAKDFLKQRVPVPQLSEQQKIGNLLSKVDQLIELENKKLENLQQVKKCLLQNMFVE